MDTLEQPATPRVLPHIPLEILGKIAEHIPDVDTARNLSRSCETLKDSGEAACWSVLDLTSGYKPPNTPDPARVLPDDEYTRRGATVDSKIEHALAAFKVHPYRVECVTSVRIEQSDGPGGRRAKSLSEILKLVAPRLRRLAINPLPCGQRTSLHRLENAFSRIDFPNLTHLQIAALRQLEESADASFGHWTERKPKLRSLEVCSATGSFVVPKPTRQLEFTPMRNLENLTVSHLYRDGSSSRMLESLLMLAPNLRTLRLRGDWYSSKNNVALQAMSNLSKLKRVVVLVGENESEDGQPAVSIRHFGKIPLHVDEAAVQGDQTMEVYEMGMEPETSRMSTLERLTILSGSCISPADYAVLSMDRSPDRSFPLPAHFIARLHINLVLTTILQLYLEPLGSPPFGHDYIEPEYFVPPERWEAEGHRGAIIRQYANPAYENREMLFHVRILTRATRNESQYPYPYVGARRSWKNLTAFDGETVPFNILQAVYAELGEGLDFKTGARGLSLPDTAWQILRDWRNDGRSPILDSDPERESSDGESEQSQDWDSGQDFGSDDGYDSFDN